MRYAHHCAGARADALNTLTAQIRHTDTDDGPQDIDKKGKRTGG